jgi:hypothetical protein
MTNIERFQSLQIELVRAGFETELHARPEGDKAVLSMYVDLRQQTGGSIENGGIERLDAITASHGFAYSVGEDSRATIALVGA